MGESSTNARLPVLIEAALDPRIVDPATGVGDPPARFLLMPDGRPAAVLAARLRAALPEEPLDLAPTLGGELILTLTARTFPLARSFSAPGAAHALARAIAEELKLEIVEADVPRPSAPVQPDRPKGLESVDAFPPGCWVPEQPELKARPRWALDVINIPAAWARSAALGRPAMGRGIVIAQPDTGVAPHPQMEGVTRAGAFNTLGDGPADDATDPLETGFALHPGHGTATGSVAVSPDRGAADMIAGSAPLARHMPIRAVRSVWLHEEIPIAQAIDQAVAAGAHVITMSLGGVTLPFSPLRRAIRRAVERHVIVMAAAGNCVNAVVYPARFEECIAVGGSTSDGGKWPGSCSGPSVDISAPGQNVYRASVEPRPEGSVGQGQGTSFAVALTAGVAACWLAHHGRDRLIREAESRGETLQTLFRRLAGASANRPAGWDGANMGAGVIDALALIEAPFDLGRGTEAPAYVSEPRAPADEMRTFLTDLLQADPELSDEFLLAHGAELAAALLSCKLDAGAEIALSPDLLAGLTGPAEAALAARAAETVAAPHIVPSAPDQDPGLSDRVDLVRRSLTMGHAASNGVGLEAAAGGKSDRLPQVSDLETRLDDLMNRMPESEVKDRSAFEAAVSLLRQHGVLGLKKLPDPDALLEPSEVSALEAVVKTDGSRPSLIVRGNAITETHPLIGGWRERLVEARARIGAIAALCGRIQPTGGHASRYSGTGFLVDPKGPWVMSNYHVLRHALANSPIPSIRTQSGMRFTRGLEIDFVAEADSLQSNRWTIEEAVLPDNAGEGFGFMDAVLFRLGRPLGGGSLPTGGPSAPLDRITLSQDISYLTGQWPLLAVVGFPAKPQSLPDPVSGIDWGEVIGTLFGNTFGVKRMAPGEFYQALGSHPSDEATRIAFGHDATVLAGASGSAVVTLSGVDAPAFGLHFAGYSNASNYALSALAVRASFKSRGFELP
ncbi:S8 family peptidase [Ancylobacter polymorphus]|uniref:Peptidase S8/S53 domain-containing protein n=1 Tax=Ancylobacter polymorphus TaxID=223390 RepID=A0ABU0BF83_9HYPH|nr:S8 family serine peptidase [Ancylobacter polymorphus]MDQ0304499.1 hypothetical protein [Ancylobacter polymorphus]